MIQKNLFSFFMLFALLLWHPEGIFCEPSAWAGNSLSRSPDRRKSAKSVAGLNPGEKRRGLKSSLAPLKNPPSQQQQLTTQQEEERGRFQSPADLASSEPKSVKLPPRLLQETGKKQALQLVQLPALLLREVALSLNPQAVLRLACCSSELLNALLANGADVTYRRQYAQDLLSQAPEITYDAFLQLNRQKVPYFASALRLRLQDGDEWAQFANSLEATQFRRIAVRVLSQAGWNAQRTQLLTQLVGAKEIELDLPGRREQALMMGDEGATQLAQLLKAPGNHLTVLRLSGNQITALGAAQLAQSLANPQSRWLRTLDLTQNPLGDEGVKLLARSLQAQHSQLAALVLQENEIEQGGARALAQALREKNSLRLLDLAGNQRMGPEGVLELAQALKHENCHLTALSLAHTSLTDEEAKAIAQALRDPHQLTELNLRSNQLGPAGISDLAQALTHPNTRLTTLDLSANLLGFAGIHALAQALTHRSNRLTVLKLNCQWFGLAGLKKLAQALVHPANHLTDLELGSNYLDRSGIVFLAKALQDAGNHLRSLNLASNPLGSAGLSQLATALKSPHCRLTRLDLRSTRLSDGGVKRLIQALKENPRSQLVSVNLSDNPVSGPLQAQLKAAAPQCQFLFSPF